jgi:hypothetical protein
MDEKLYNKLAIELAFHYAPKIYPCKKCEHPVAKGYCCGFCGDKSPYLTKEEEEKEEN